VRRLTSPNDRSQHQYFYCNMWTQDSGCVLVTSNRGDGVFRLYLVDVESGAGLCLTDGDRPVRQMAELAHDDAHLLYPGGRELRRLSLPDLQDEVLYTQPEPWTGGGMYYSPTRDHARVVMVEMHRDDRIEAKTGWDAFAPQFHARPRCRLVELDCGTGAATVLHEDVCWLGHPNYRPDGRTVMFCHEGPWHLVDSRIWFIDPDGGNLREGRQRDPAHPPGEETGERWGHEFWLADSSRAAYVFFPREYGERATLRLLDPDTLEEEVLMPVSHYSHFIFNREATLVVGDGNAPQSDALYVVDVATRTEHVLCRHGSSMRPYIDARTGEVNTQAAHPHPCFSPDSRRVVFTSDRDGEPAVYVVPDIGVFTS
jgi:oligogalacturonide lyase